MEGQGVAVLTSANVMCFQVRRQSEKWREAGPAVGEVAGHKVSAPDKDTTILRLPHRHESKGSSDIGPIWTELGVEQSRHAPVPSLVKIPLFL